MTTHIDLYGLGQRILLIHGSGCNSTIWHGQRDSLQTSMEVALIDLPGHGKSSGDGCTTIGSFSEAVLEAMEEVGKEPYFVAGHSLGSAIALLMALHRPERIKGLILIGSGARLRVLPSIIEGVSKDRPATLQLINSLSFGTETSPEIKQAGLRTIMECPSEVIYKDFTACDHFDMMASISSITTPALIICGSEDSLTPVKYSNYLAENMAHAQLTVIKEAGHMVMMEKPDEVNDAIKTFMASTSLVN
jgi:pimeloyl-ACP methyl ester carboxylesterase